MRGGDTKGKIVQFRKGLLRENHWAIRCYQCCESQLSFRGASIVLVSVAHCSAGTVGIFRARSTIAALLNISPQLVAETVHVSAYMRVFWMVPLWGNSEHLLAISRPSHHPNSRKSSYNLWHGKYGIRNFSEQGRAEISSC